jgi:cysteine-rich repeat protein
LRIRETSARALNADGAASIIRAMRIFRPLLVLATVLVVASALPLGAKKKIPPCPPARYALAPGDAGLIFGETTPKTDAFQLGATTLSIPTCGSTKAKVKGTAQGTKIQALWKTCGALKKVQAKATIAPGCNTMTGTIKAKKVTAHPFSAALSTGCGDGLIDTGLGEECEGDADCSGGETCTPQCTCAPAATTTTTTPGSTTTTTEAPFCGDGHVDAGEQCDDGNFDPTDGCTTDCTICGNGVTTPPETCDDGNLTSGDGCDANCTPSGCGNGLIVPPETCDDGNTDNNDDCPADCIEKSCTADPTTTFGATVTWGAPSSISGITVLVDYPEDRVDLPGTGGNIPPGVLTSFPSGVSEQHNDLGNQGHALREVVTKATAITPRPGTLFKITFDRCQGVAAPAAGDFTCTVIGAFATDGVTPVAATCAVTVP